MDAELFLASACELLAIPSTSEQPGEFRRALDYVLDFVGPGFTVERFESGGKPSALLYPGRERRGVPRHPERPPRRRPGSGCPVPAVSRRRPPVRPRCPGHEAVRPAGRPGLQGAGRPAALPDRPPAGHRRGGRRPGRHPPPARARGQGDFVIVGETSGLDIVSESKGMLVVRLLAAGRNAHSAYPWLGDNALVTLQSSVASLLARYPAPAEEVWRTTVTLARVRT